MWKGNLSAPAHQHKGRLPEVTLKLTFRRLNKSDPNLKLADNEADVAVTVQWFKLMIENRCLLGTDVHTVGMFGSQPSFVNLTPRLPLHTLYYDSELECETEDYTAL